MGRQNSGHRGGSTNKGGSSNVGQPTRNDASKCNGCQQVQGRHTRDCPNG